MTPNSFQRCDLPHGQRQGGTPLPSLCKGLRSAQVLPLGLTASWRHMCLRAHIFTTKSSCSVGTVPHPLLSPSCQDTASFSLLPHPVSLCGKESHSTVAGGLTHPESWGKPSAPVDHVEERESWGCSPCTKYWDSSGSCWQQGEVTTPLQSMAGAGQCKTKCCASCRSPALTASCATFPPLARPLAPAHWKNSCLAFSSLFIWFLPGSGYFGHFSVPSYPGWHRRFLRICFPLDSVEAES